MLAIAATSKDRAVHWVTERRFVLFNKRIAIDVVRSVCDLTHHSINKFPIF